jgi:uncharacterized membrane protein YozB (DUF420 family)
MTIKPVHTQIAQPTWLELAYTRQDTTNTAWQSIQGNLIQHPSQLTLVANTSGIVKLNAAVLCIQKQNISIQKQSAMATARIAWRHLLSKYISDKNQRYYTTQCSE